MTHWMDCRLVWSAVAIGVSATLTTVLSSTAMNSPNAAVRAIAYFDLLSTENTPAMTAGSGPRLFPVGGDAHRPFARAHHFHALLLQVNVPQTATGFPLPSTKADRKSSQNLQGFL